MPKKKVQGKVEEKPKSYMLGTEQLGEPIERTAKNVAIVGFAPSSMADAAIHFGDPDWEIWPLNQLYMAFPRIVEHATRWFQIHPRNHYDSSMRDHSHHKWLGERKGFPIYMANRWPDIPMSVQYPKDFIANQFRRYFTNSISWMIATAMYENLFAWSQGLDGFETIAIYGVDMAMGGPGHPGAEYSFERPSVEYFCGIVDGANVARQASGLKGCNMIIPTKSDICKTLFLYPFEETAPFREKLMARKNELNNRLNQNAMEEQRAHDARIQLIGAQENMNYILYAWENSAHEQMGELPLEYFQELKQKTDPKILGLEEDK